MSRLSMMRPAPTTRAAVVSHFRLVLRFDARQRLNARDAMPIRINAQRQLLELLPALLLIVADGFHKDSRSILRSFRRR